MYRSVPVVRSGRDLIAQLPPDLDQQRVERQLRAAILIQEQRQMENQVGMIPAELQARLLEDLKPGVVGLARPLQQV